MSEAEDKTLDALKLREVYDAWIKTQLPSPNLWQAYVGGYRLARQPIVDATVPMSEEPTAEECRRVAECKRQDALDAANDAVIDAARVTSLRCRKWEASEGRWDPVFAALRKQDEAVAALDKLGGKT